MSGLVPRMRGARVDHLDASHLALRLREVRGLTPNEIHRGTRDCHFPSRISAIAANIAEG